MAQGKAVPKIAVGPQDSADWACDAVRAGGGGSAGVGGGGGSGIVILKYDYVTKKAERKIYIKISKLIGL